MDIYQYVRSENTFLFSLGLIFLILWLLYLFLMLGSTADDFFCPSLAVIASIMQLSDSIAGVTILAFGNGAPDIFTSLVSASEEGIIMFTELIGAGVFVTTMIAGSIAVVKPFRVPLKLLMRDACFYMMSICWISYVVNDEIVYIWEAVSLILCYGLFIATVILMQMHETREEKLKTRIPNVSDPNILRTYLANKDIASIPRISTRKRAFGLRTKLDVAVATELQSEQIRGNLSLPEEPEEIEDPNRPKGLFKEFLYDINPISKDDWTSANWVFKIILIIRSPVMLLLQLFIPLVNTTATMRGWSKLLNCFQLCMTPTFALFLLNVWHTHFGPVSIIPIFLGTGTVIGVIVFLTTDKDRIPKYHNVFAFLGFLTAMMMVYLIAGEVVAVLQCVGYAFSISDAMLGITLLAWGNSVGDMISNLAIAKRGFPRMGYAACFGGPMFNTLLGLGLTYGRAAVNYPNLYTKMRMSDMAPGCIAFLLCSLLVTIIYLNITGAIARRSYGYTLYCIYFSFMMIQFLSEFKVIHPLGTDHRPTED
ncbi:mitochondrial sodium/calcium exchanger protein isoform X2 [Osmia lignaria lignaria]|uniref:mitochondrial sodium/calcium exchanger protein isoform X2 n=1 Tax=Osmia lignaria lignaria TaxID=1437193 RepID=UPI0014797A22|nr:putative sodium/calcium exchanger 7 isoform X2 [Osmia lignaria]